VAKLLIDATPLVRARFDGISRYAQELVANLKQPYSLVGFIDDKVPAAYQPNFRKLPIPRRLYSLLNKTIGVPAIGSKDDVMLCLNFFEFPKSRAKKIIFVHDLAYLGDNDNVQTRNRWALKQLVPESIKRAAKVATISQVSAKLLAKTYGIKTEDIAIIYPGLDQNRVKKASSAQIEKARAKYGLPAKYILFIGTLEPRKNIMGIIDAYASLPHNLRQDYGLVLGGKFGWHDQAFSERLAQLRAEGQAIVTPGYIDDNDLAALYTGASVLAFPSIDEGFGIPALEAMACDVPVVTSDIEVLREVAGPAAIFTNPHDPKSIATGLEKVLTDSKLAAELVQKGRARIKHFTWSASAAELQSVIDKL